MNTDFYQTNLQSVGGALAPLQPTDINLEVWRELKGILRGFVQNQAASTEQAQRAIQLMQALQMQLQDKPPFVVALRHANTISPGDGSWHKTLLLQDDDMFLKLMTYFADPATPIHDWPGTAMVSLVLSGRLHIDYYTTSDAALQSTYPICRMRRTETHSYGAHEATMCFPWQKNIQEIHATTARSVVLSAGLTRHAPKDASWYLPISPRNTADFFAQRLKRSD